MTLVDIRVGDLSQARADAIAIPTSVKAKAPGGAEAALHTAAGPALPEARKALGDLAVGDVGVTDAGRLPAKVVLHGVGPRWQEGLHGEPTLLKQLYATLVRRARENECRTVALPSFGTGSHGFPVDQAASLAVEALEKALVGSWGEPETNLRLVRFWMTHEPTADAYRRALDRGNPRLRAVRWEDRPFSDSGEEPTSETRPFPYRRLLDEDEATLVRAGLPALDMGEKWWGHFDGTHLRLYRSWTGFEIFSMRLRPRADGQAGAILDQLNVCDDGSRWDPMPPAGEVLEILESVLRLVLRD